MQDLRDMQLIGDDLQQFQQNIQLLRKYLIILYEMKTHSIHL